MIIESQLVRPKAASSPARVLIIVCAGVVLASLDLFIVNVALPQIARDLHTSSLSELSWVLNGYAIVYASLLVFFGGLCGLHQRGHADRIPAATGGGRRAAHPDVAQPDPGLVRPGAPVRRGA